MSGSRLDPSVRLSSQGLDSRAPPVRFDVRPLPALYGFVLRAARGLVATELELTTPADTRWLAEVANLLPFGDTPQRRSAPRRPRSAPRRPPLAFDRLGAVAAAHADDLDGLLEALAVWMPHHSAARVISALEHFAPRYDEVVWRPRVGALHRWAQKLNDASRDGAFEDLARSAALFYRTTWDRRVAFRILVHPSLTTSLTTSTLEANLVALSVAGEPRDLERHLGIVLHELCHAFDEQSELRAGGMVALDNFDRSLAVYASRALEEALPTVIGNSWAVSRLGGDPGDHWYDNWHVNTYATALDPLVRGYLEASKAMDDAFLARAVECYSSAVGSRMWDLDNLFAHVTILVASGFGDEQGGIADRLARYFPLVADVDQLDGIAEQTLDLLLDSQGTRVIVLGVGDEEATGLLRDRLTWIEELKLPGDIPFVCRGTGVHEPAVFVFAIRTLADLDRAVLQLKRRMPNAGELYWLDPDPADR